MIGGAINTTLKKAIQRIDDAIDDGAMLHRLTAHSNAESPAVSWFSELAGGADYPPESIWDRPRQEVSMAVKALYGGKTRETGAQILFASGWTSISAKKLAQYIHDANLGASRVVRVLSVVAFIGQIAGIVVAVVGIAAAAIRLLATEGLALEAGEGMKLLDPVRRRRRPRRRRIPVPKLWHARILLGYRRRPGIRSTPLTGR